MTINTNNLNEFFNNKNFRDIDEVGNLVPEKNVLRSKKFKQEILSGDKTLTFYPVADVTEENLEQGLITEVTKKGIRLACGHVVFNLEQVTGECCYCKSAWTPGALVQLIESFTGPEERPVENWMVCSKCLNICHFCGRKICPNHSFYEQGTYFCKRCYEELLIMEQK